MKRLLLPLCLILAAVVLYLGTRTQHETTAPAPSSKSSQKELAHSPSNNESALRSSKRTNAVVQDSEAPVQAQSEPVHAADDFVKKVISETWIDASEDKAGRRRVRVVEADFKYPHLRLEEEVWTDPDTGEQTVKRLRASVADHLMVGLKQGADEMVARNLLEQNGYRVRAVEPGSFILAELDDFQQAESQQKSIAEIQGLNEFIDFAEPDYLVYPTVTPNDPAYGSQKMWGLHNPGISAGTVADADIDAPEGWDIRHDAANVVVAVTDTGIQYNHEDLVNNMWSDGSGNHGYDAYDDDLDPMDTGGHGTHCAGTIGAQGNNNIGLTGVAWDVQLMGLRFLGPQGGSTSDGIKVINYARENGADIISASWGGGGYSQSLYNAIQAAGNAGIPFIAAAGNDALNNDSTPHYPSSYDLPTLVAVASTTSSDQLSTFSCYGRYSVDIGAPGSSIWSAYIGSNSSYKNLNGTSMATPHVSGAMALARAQFPGDDAVELIARLYSSVDHISALAGKVSTGGRLNLHKLLGASASVVSNDDFDDALRFEGDYGFWSGSNKTATREADEDDFNPIVTGSRSLWYAWKAPFSGLVEFEVRADVTPFRVIAFSGDERDNLVVVADGNETPDTTETIRFYCEEDQEYRFLIDSSHAQGQSLVVSLALKPANDAFGDAIYLSGSRFSTSGSNRDATSQPFEDYSPHAGVGQGNSVWWRWTADFDGEFVITTQGSEFDTVLAVYTGTPGVNFNEVASNDDRNALDWTSQVTFAAESGTTYYIAVDGYRGDASGGILLNGFEAGSLVIVYQPSSRSVKLGDTVDFSVHGAGSNTIQYQWYKNGTAISGARSNSLRIENVIASDFTTYYAILSDGTNTIQSNQVALTELRVAPQIVVNPKSRSVATGENLWLSPQVTGSAPLTYQWYKDDVALTGETGVSLAITNAQVANNGHYHLEVSNELGTAETALIDIRVSDVPWSVWNQRYPTPQSNDIHDMIYAEGMFVAIGSGGAITTSVDCESWRLHSVGDNGFRLRRIAYGGGKWLAADWSGNFVSSDDGETWHAYSNETIGVSSGVTELFYWNGKFHYITRDTGDSFIYSSVDGMSWTLTKSFPGRVFNSPIFSADRLVLIESYANAITATTDMVTWAEGTAPTVSGAALKGGEGVFIDGEFRVWSNEGGKKLWQSSDGVTWTYTDYNSETNWIGRSNSNTSNHRIQLHDGKVYWANGNDLYVSEDGIHWASYSPGFDVNAVTVGNGLIAISGGGGVTASATKPYNLYGEDLSGLYSDTYFSGLKVVNNRAWVYGSAGYFSSADGLVWREEETLVDVDSLIYANDSYWSANQIAVNGSDQKIYRGLYPTNMTEVSESNLSYITKLAYHDGTFVAFSTFPSGSFYTSSDGIHWTSVGPSFSGGYKIKKLEYIGDRFVGLSSNGKIYTSPDGTTWSVFDTGENSLNDPEVLAYGLDYYLAAGTEGKLWSSQDGVTWSVQDLSSYRNGSGNGETTIAADDHGVAVFMGNKGFYSTDLQSWVEFSLPAASFSAASSFAGSVVAAGGYGSMAILQGGSPLSNAPVVGFDNLTHNGRYSVNSRIAVQTTAFDPEAGAILVSFWVNGVKISESTVNNPEFLWYPTSVGEYVLRVEATDVSGVRNEARIVVNVSGSTTIGNHARLSNASAVTTQGDSLFLLTETGGVAIYGEGEVARDLVLPTSDSLTSVAYSGGVYLVAGDEVFASSDGINWTLIPDLSGEASYHGGKFFITSSGKLSYSDDGFNWTTVDCAYMPATGGQVLYFNNLIWVCGGNQIAVSENGGLTWITSGIAGNRLVLSNEEVMTLANGQIRRSTDGLTWTTEDSPGNLSGFFIESGGRIFLCQNHILSGYVLKYFSVDGSTWAPLDVDLKFYEMSYGHGQWVCFGPYAAYRSSDGITWELFLGDESLQSPAPDTPFEQTPFNARSWQIAYQEDTGFVAVGYTWSDQLHAVSPDGVNWTYEKGASLQSEGLDLFAIHNGRAVTTSNGAIQWSDDLLTWEDVGNQPSGDVNQLTIVNGSYACVTSSGELGLSADGVNWTYQTVAADVPLAAVSYGNGKFVVLRKSHASVYVSMDGSTWTTHTLPNDSYKHVSFENEEFFVTDGYYSTPRLARSADGQVWTGITATPYLTSSTKFAYGGGYYLVSDGSRIYLTTDFSEWHTVSLPIYNTYISSVVYRSGRGFLISTSNGYYEINDDLSVAEYTTLSGQSGTLHLDGQTLYILSTTIEVETDDDLEISDLTMTPVTAGIGDTFTATVDMVNHGSTAVASDALSFSFTASKDAVYGNGDDVPMATGLRVNSPLLAQSNDSVLFEIVIPETIAAGNYMVFVSALTSSELRDRNPANNHFSTSEATLVIPEWVLNLDIDGNGQINQDFSALRYPHGAQVSLTANAGKGAAFAGWAGDAVGAESQITILMDGDKSVQANFSSRASLQLYLRGAGAVDGLADLGSYALNDTATLTATASPGWEFSGWSGAATGSNTSANILMDEPKVVTAEFTLSLANWKSEHFTAAELADPLISGDEADPDGDGLKNWQEYLHLADPRDQQSTGVDSTKVAGGYLYMIFQRNAGATDGYSLECQGSRNLTSWDSPDFEERVLSSVDGVETVEARLPSTGNSKGFIRLQYNQTP
ncbi:S8 family serine peptidase [Verrucomicrobiaceae bacterium R5-34]|nr:S8 family serine peptidase [Verrucomicrobiaceae bacterium R5-34]